MTPATDKLDPAALRARRLERMRALATGLLAAMAAVFVAAGLAGRRWPGAAMGLDYVRAFAEAAMVGACADWFAVTALFRHPLGLPIPHTAVIPRNKDRIGSALGGFIADNFLTAQVLDERLRRLELAAWGGAWLADPPNARRVAERVAALAPDIADALPAGAVQAVLGSATLAAVKAAPAAPLAARLLSAMWDKGRAQPLIDHGAGALGRYLAEHEEMILAEVSAQTYTWLPGWADKMIARKLTEGLIRLLDDVRSPAHPLRARLAEAVDGLIARLAEDPHWRAQGEALKVRLLADPRLQVHARTLMAGLGRGLGANLRENAEGLTAGAERALLSLADWLQGDTQMQQGLNASARALAARVLAPRRNDIGGFVAQVVAGWDARRVVEKLELQVGADLQYIRINGTLVGGLVGLAIHAGAKVTGLG